MGKAGAWTTRGRGGGVKHSSAADLDPNDPRYAGMQTASGIYIAPVIKCPHCGAVSYQDPALRERLGKPVCIPDWDRNAIEEHRKELHQ